MLPHALEKAGLWLAGGIGAYAVLIGLLLTPPLQRFALYANSFNTLFWDNVNDGEAFGFAKHQVTPFNIQTPDGELLYAWHILPTDVYARNEKEIRREERPHDRPVDDFTETVPFQLLRSNSPSPARVLISCLGEEVHGNAGHIAQGWRTEANRFMAAKSNTHILTIDYRGFGHSTGAPTEAGLIVDGVALVNWVMDVAGIPPERIVILGQSLGTAVSTAVALQFADPKNSLVPPGFSEQQSLMSPSPRPHPTTFAGVILAAPFNSVPTLLLTYRMGGLLPLLLPLRPFPYIAELLLSNMVDKWETAERLAAYYTVLKDSPSLRIGHRSMGSLQVLHAINDADIPHHQTGMICRRILGQRGSPSDSEDSEEIEGEPCVDPRKGADVLDLARAGLPRVRFEILKHGGHNRIITYSPVAVAVDRAFDDLFD